MTYRELYESAINKLEKSEITLGEFEKIVEPLNAEVGGDSDTISRKAAIDAVNCVMVMKGIRSGKSIAAEAVESAKGIMVDNIRRLPSTQPEIVKCKDCKYWHRGSCECPEHVVCCQDYMVGDIETKAEHFCGYGDARGEQDG